MSAAVGAFLTSIELARRARRGCRVTVGLPSTVSTLVGWYCSAAGFAGRVLLFAQHRDRRVRLGQLLRPARRLQPASAPARRRCARRAGGAARASRAPATSDAAGHQPGQRTSVRRRQGVAPSSLDLLFDLAGRHRDQGDDEGDRHHRGHRRRRRSARRGRSRGGSLSTTLPDRWRRPVLGALRRRRPPWLIASAISSAGLPSARRAWRRGRLQVRLVLEDQDRAEHREAEAGAEVAHRLGDPGRLAVAARRRPG